MPAIPSKPRTMPPQNLPRIAPVASETSVESLDIKTLLANAPSENILTASFSCLSNTSSTHSFSSIPTFPSQGPSTPLFVNRISASPQDENHTITIPTQPRLKAMLMEPIVVDCWTKGLPSKLSEIEALESAHDDEEIPTWIAEGRILPQETFMKLFRSAANLNPDSAIAEESVNAESQGDSLCVEVSLDEQVLEGGSPVIINPCGESSGVALGVPTIMLSNSSAAVSLSLESSQSLAPLAVRRGHKAPAPLNLSAHITTEDGLYPGIPSPFLGSPAIYSPKYEVVNNPVDSSLDLSTLCQDLRSRCPPLRLDFPVPPTTPVSPADTSTASAYNELDSDDWAFAADFLDQHADVANVSFHLDSELPETPLKIVPDILDDAPLATSTPEIDSYSWSSDPTLTNSPESPDHPAGTDANDTASDPDAKDSDQANKQQRRRTVIIETPRNSMIEGAKSTRVTIDLSHLASADADGNGDSALSHEQHEPIPFETPRPRSNTVSSVFSERPMSSASMRAPVRGILKSREKKSVRFSVMPSMHEYAEDDDALEGEASFDTGTRGDREERGRDGALLPTSALRGRKRASSEPQTATQKRQSTAAAEKPSRTSFPKHPAIRSFVRGNTASPTPPPRTSAAARQSLPGVLAARNIEKADVGSPVKLMKRSHLSSAPPARSGDKDKRASSGHGSFGRKSFSNKENKENIARRASEAAPVAKASSGGSPKRSIKSIFTRFRA